MPAWGSLYQPWQISK
jgi:hypothetical protein